MKYVQCDCGRTSRLVSQDASHLVWAHEECRSKWHPHARLVDVSLTNRIWVEEVETTGTTRDWELWQEETDRMLERVLASAGVGPVERMEPKEDLIPR